MPKSKRPVTELSGRKGKVRKAFWLDPKALRRAQSVLGTATERETVERALDLVAFGADVQVGVTVLEGKRLQPRG